MSMRIDRDLAGLVEPNEERVQLDVGELSARVGVCA